MAEIARKIPNKISHLSKYGQGALSYVLDGQGLARVSPPVLAIDLLLIDFVTLLFSPCNLQTLVTKFAPCLDLLHSLLLLPFKKLFLRSNQLRQTLVRQTANINLFTHSLPNLSAPAMIQPLHNNNKQSTVNILHDIGPL